MPGSEAGTGSMPLAGSPAGLPLDIAFLARHGVPPSQLIAAANHASRLGIAASRQIVASGIVDAETFYRAFAAECGLPFQCAAPRLRPGGDHAAILRAGLAAVDATPAGGRFRFAMAPEGEALRRMLESGPRDRGDVVVTTPAAFAAALRESNGAGLARHLAGEDEAGLSRRSARTGASQGQQIGALLGLLISGALAFASPLQTFFGIAMLAGPIFFGIVFLRLAAMFERPSGDLWRAHGWRLDDARLPVYTVAVPLCREERVLPQLIAALSRLDYPPAKLDIRLLVESGDAGTRAALCALSLPGHIGVTIVPPGEPRTKPRALNLALLEARGTLFTIYDAEDIPDPQQLRMAAARFLRLPEDCACLQAHLAIDEPGNGWLSALFALEYAALFEVVNPGLLACGLPILLGGTSNHFRTAALREVGGWDAWNVTEDADLALRLARAGYRMADLPSRTWEEAPPSVASWLKQRSRWIKGYIQTLVTHLQAPAALVREAGPAATLTFLLLGLGTVLTALGFPVFAVAAFFAFRDGWLLPEGPLGGLGAALAMIVCIAGAATILVPPVLGALRRGSPRLLLWLPLLVVYYALISLAAFLALHEYATRRFVWNKTAHGLAKRSPPPLLTDAAAIRPQPRPAAARR